MYVDAIVEPPLPDRAEVRERVTQDWIETHRQTITDQYFAEILDRYDIVIEREKVPDGSADEILSGTPRT